MPSTFFLSVSSTTNLEMLCDALRLRIVFILFYVKGVDAASDLHSVKVILKRFKSPLSPV